MRPYVSAFLVLLGVLSWSLCHGAREPAHPLFFIERSKNRNIVQYDIRPPEEGNLAVMAPVVAYWILENGEESRLSAIQEKYAYGIASQKRLGEDQYEIVLTAFRKRKITVKKTNDGYKAFVMIDGRESVLERIYVESRDGLIGLPRVYFVDVFGRDDQSNLPVTERIFPQSKTNGRDTSLFH